MRFVHVSGTIIIQPGTGGLSIIDMFEGALNVKSMLYFVALHKGDIEVSHPFLEWIYS